MLSNAYFLAKFRSDTAENEPAKNLQNFANCPNFANLDRLAPHATRAAARPDHLRGGQRGAADGGDARRVQGRAGRPVSAPGGGDVRERRLAKFRQNVARLRLYRHRSLQLNTRFAAFFKICQIM